MYVQKKSDFCTFVEFLIVAHSLFANSPLQNGTVLYSPQKVFEVTGLFIINFQELKRNNIPNPYLGDID